MGQVWVYADIESPSYRSNGIKLWNNLFNWTMTYRRDSDTPHFYGSLTKKVKAVDHALFNRKIRSMLWIVSNCQTAGKRELFVKQLQKYTPVDVIGRCGVHICPKGNNHCQLLLMNNYKFLFAAENSNCRDYVTEKAYRPYGNFILPVVRGGGNYSLYFPPKSHINTGDFVSQTFVGNYEYLRNTLNYLDVNKEIYQSYISVIKQYKADILGVPMGVAFCKLCDKLNNQSKYRRLYRNIHDWWRGQEQTSGYFCEKDELARL
ncbi:hypothetical protein FSP39_022491 [Pinctada imbricata]|uniref:Fucosyltransferase n=1 Tax=Pinctada imbricata TaxID=66713 RepID=A0AA89C2U9_PINIB|nr:hypothetical protein FSP39_022491 [Pinctada imbricata]